MAATSDQLRPPKAAELDDCPAPLSCRDVLAAFDAHSRRWTIEAGPRKVSGRTWGDGPPLYFLNGLGGTHAGFAFLLWLLREEFRCVVFDYPSRETNADRKPTALTAGGFADTLFAAADSHGDRTFSLFASSFGCLVALSAMLKRPERIERAVLQGGFACRNLSRIERLLIRLCLRVPGALRRLPLRALVQRNNHRRWFPPFDTVRWDFFSEDTGRVPIADLAERCAVIRDTDLRSRLADISQPVLLVHSEGDGLVAAECHRELERGLPQAQSEWLTHCGHLPAITHPHRLAKLIRGFVSRQ